MRILFLGGSLPIPANNGQAIRSLSILRALASANHELVFVSSVSRHPVPDLGPLTKLCRDITLVPQQLVNMSSAKSYGRRLRSLLSFRAYAIERFRSRQIRQALEDLLQREKFDLVVADGLYSVVNLPVTDVPVALNCHNVEYLIFDRYANLEKNPAKKWYARLEARWIRLAERVACQRASLAMVCSDDDRLLISALSPALPVSVVPNTVDTDFYKPTDTGDEDPKAPILLFQGSMDWYPNRDAVEFFARRVLPIIRQQVPDARFVVAGRNPAPEFVSKLADVPGMQFTGTVADMRPYVMAAAVAVVPLRMGSGTRIKILEACAAARPVVSTRVGAEGLDLADGREILLADEPSEFAHAVCGLLKDIERRHQIGSNAREKVVQTYSHEVLRTNVSKVVAGVLTASSTAASAVGR